MLDWLVVFQTPLRLTFLSISISVCPLSQVEVARYGPDGVVSWGDDSSRAGRGGGGSMEKEVEGRYSLRLFSAHPADTGVYRCAVSVYAGRLNPGPSSAATLTQRSEGVSINLKTKGKRKDRHTRPPQTVA